MENGNVILSTIPIEELESRFESRIQISLQKLLTAALSKNTQTEEHDILTFKEGCKFLNIAEATGYAKVSKREVPFLKKGKFIYFSKKQLTDWLHSGQKKTVDQLEEDAKTFTRKPIRK